MSDTDDPRLEVVWEDEEADDSPTRQMPPGQLDQLRRMAGHRAPSQNRLEAVVLPPSRRASRPGIALNVVPREEPEGEPKG